MLNRASLQEHGNDRLHQPAGRLVRGPGDAERGPHIWLHLSAVRQDPRRGRRILRPHYGRSRCQYGEEKKKQKLVVEFSARFRGSGGSLSIAGSVCYRREHFSENEAYRKTKKKDRPGGVIVPAIEKLFHDRELVTNGNSPRRDGPREEVSDECRTTCGCLLALRTSRIKPRSPC